ncbi:MAG: Glu/Leu/Phe/Val dehydrogenase [Myxococcota bacterium]
MDIFDRIAERNHEQVVLNHDPETGLRAIVAIHDTTLGPALGGTRMWVYEDDGAALNDALRLARGMTYKSAAAGLNLGGGKAVIIGNSKTDKNEMLFRSYGRFIQGLAGRYITAEDVGTTVQDMEWVRTETDYVVGISRSLGGSGDPSPFTALGVLQGMRAALAERTGSDSLDGKTVAVQGVGHVGFHLVGHIVRGGGRVVVADIDKENLRRATREHREIEVVEPDDIYDVDCDVFAPCALGAVVNDDTLPRLKCAIVAGATNNVLAEDRHGQALASRDILYAPDYVVNAGGLINVANELEGYNPTRSTQQVEKIYDITREIFRIAKDQGVTTAHAADKLAERRIASVARMKATHVPWPPRRGRR